MNTDQYYEVRIDGSAFWVDGSGETRYRRTVTCHTCDVGWGLTLSAQGRDCWFACPNGHNTRDWRLSPEAVRELAASVEASQFDTVPRDAYVDLEVSRNVKGYRRDTGQRGNELMLKPRGGL
jgi:hypothetical protein